MLGSDPMLRGHRHPPYDFSCLLGGESGAGAQGVVLGGARPEMPRQMMRAAIRQRSSNDPCPQDFKNMNKYLHIYLRENQTCTKSWSPFCIAFAPPLLFPQGELALFRYRKTTFFCGKSLFPQDLLYESTVFPHQETWGKT